MTQNWQVQPEEQREEPVLKSGGSWAVLKQSYRAGGPAADASHLSRVEQNHLAQDFFCRWRISSFGLKLC